MGYSVYIVECADRTYYTGIAIDVQRRLAEHNGGGDQTVRGKGARYTSARRPVVLVFEASFETRSAAMREEARVKRLTRQEKQQLIALAAKAKGA